MAMDGFGNAMAVWVQDSHIWANRFVAGTLSLEDATQIEVSAGTASNPQVAMDGSGNAMAVWTQGNDV
ncbi:MAG TPA: hypothetical protein VJM77_07390 [Nitrospiria bacterium]|nr:hypothetical protein [Nitrospiria bacterium]